MKYIIIALLAAGAFMFSGCMAAKNIENSKQLRVGMQKSKVLEIMGEPLTEEEYNTPDVWYYYVETVWVDGLTTRDECMPVVFEDGKLIGWGNRFYTQYRSRGVRNAREIVLTGEESTPVEVTKKADTPVKVKENTAPAVPETPAAEVKKPQEPKPQTAPQTPAAKGPKKPVTVDDLVKEMENKK